MDENYDIAIIGAGLGGLLCAVILAKEGKKVILIEQNNQLGGCLQTFAFQKKVFDSCVHYIGAFEEGQTQNKIFRYVNIMDQLKIEQLNPDAFDQITFGTDSKFFPQAQGSENFISQLSKCFPKEKESLKNYLQLIDYTTAHFPLYQLNTGDNNLKHRVTSWELSKTMNSIVPNKQLQNILLGNNLLYAGREGYTPFYIHALVVKSYIDSAGKFTHGSSQITKQLTLQFRQHGGQILKREKVVGLSSENGKIKSAITDTGKSIHASLFIANIHPKQLLPLLDEPLFKPVYTKRMVGTENTISAFMVNLVFKKQTIAYPKSNIYWHKHANALSAINYQTRSWPECYALYFNKDLMYPQYAESVSVLTYMRIEEWEAWISSFNNSTHATIRPEEYEAFKHKKTEQLLQVVGQRFPEIKSNIIGIQVATPLTFRDYLGTDDGNIYGIEKNIENPVQTQIPVASKIPNLFFTGQNAGIHGVLGVSITAINTCGAILGLPYLIAKIKDSL